MIADHGNYLVYLNFNIATAIPRPFSLDCTILDYEVLDRNNFQ